MRSLLIYLFLISVVAVNLNTDRRNWVRTVRRKYVCSIFSSPNLPEDECWPSSPTSFLEDEPIEPVSSSHRAPPEILDNAFDALSTMQQNFFHSELGTWPSSIDWTAAVLQTHLSGMTASLSQVFSTLDLAENSTKTNMLDLYFSQTVASYFGQDHLAIRGQAYDDMLWVVLGWLEGLQLIKTRNASFYNHPSVGSSGTPQLNKALGSQIWHGNYWTKPFAHRARVFWGLASTSWDTKLCGGGMNWNPHELVYKNAVTNELWISASIQMYLHFPGDDITTPWQTTGTSGLYPSKDPRYLQAAVEGYKWLMSSNMTNSHGLFVDGFHISGRNGSSKCDQRNEMVFTYNQGVILTGQRGLWEATGSPSYLHEGHALIQNVILASGWNFKTGAPRDQVKNLPPGLLPPWRGLGRGGILEEMCDSSATCSQNGHTFKGIFFHHMSHFCRPLDTRDLDVRSTERSLGYDESRFNTISDTHAHACRSYIPWLKHNAQAALQTRDKSGIFGTWWSAGLLNLTNNVPNHGGVLMTSSMVDYRNHPVERVNEWGNGNMPKMAIPGVSEDHKDYAVISPQDNKEDEDHVLDTPPGQQVMGNYGNQDGKKTDTPFKADGGHFTRGDPNDRGRGRTVETHNGGIAVLRAWWDISRI
ncbi:hypothetical protein CFIMG_003782RA [Ceratocystis fimbriata CBS 114723]|uniref:Glycosyl hydrolase n=1 Tax=Ceratocystis fimbriata CBS 114723 TaxID=1035309 RepID=A0A2C5X444_9PEZI|nr:hypothetical protein CFIMG_003782RA [Ceratocystis fimbriata CBS 114723]